MEWVIGRLGSPWIDMADVVIVVLTIKFISLWCEKKIILLLTKVLFTHTHALPKGIFEGTIPTSIWDKSQNVMLMRKTPV